MVAVALREEAKTVIWVERGSDDWRAMWDALPAELVARQLGDGLDRAQRHDGEAWQYMGSEVCLGCGEVKHVLRHRHHPVTKRREVLKISGSSC